MLLVSSELDEIYALADRIAVMYEGQIVAFCPPTISEQELGLLMAGSAPAGSTAPGVEVVPGTPSAAAAEGVPGAGSAEGVPDAGGEPETSVPAQEPSSHE